MFTPLHQRLDGSSFSRQVSRAALHSSSLAETPQPREVEITSEFKAPVPSNVQLTEHACIPHAPPNRRKQAIKLFEAANELLNHALFAAAVTKYRAAIELWDHPLIQYNLALALISLERTILAYEAILDAVRCGPDALGRDIYRRAKDYERLLRKQIVDVTVICDEPESVVTLDGKVVCTDPGVVQMRSLPGKVMCTVRRPGYLVANEVLTLSANERFTIDFNLIAESDEYMTVRPLPPWVPWSLIALGGALATTGSISMWQERQAHAEARKFLSDACPDGCLNIPASVRQARERADTYRVVSYAAFSLASAAAVSGIVSMVMNRPRRVKNPRLDDMVSVEVVPVDKGEGAGISVQGTF